MPGPSFPEVLHEIRASEARLQKGIDKTNQTVDRIDTRVDNLEYAQLRSRTQQSTLVSLVTHGKTVVAGIVGAFAAIVGTGFFF
jgi:hypothetical protein